MPFRDIFPELLEFILEPLAKDIDVVGRTIIDAPDEDTHEEGRGRPPVPEPDGTGDHGAEGVSVLDEHECWFLKGVREAEYEAADPGFGVGAAEPSKGSWAAGCDLVPAADGDEEMV